MKILKFYEIGERGKLDYTLQTQVCHDHLMHNLIAL
jgi:hypothetical protein